MSPPKFIYFARPVGMDGPIKIGCSAKPISRLKVLASWSPFELEFIGTAPGSFDDEAFLHKRFSDLHTKREWFMSSPLLRATIEAILAGKSVREACAGLPEKMPLRNQKRPIPTDDRKLFLYYGNRVRAARDALWKYRDGVTYREPSDVKAILHNWRCDRANGHLPIPPSLEQIARLEEFIADPKKHSVCEKDKPWPKVVKDPICIPVFGLDEIAA